jgi:sugar phosphate permease
VQTETLATGPKESATRRTIKNLRWWILGWALAAGIINYMDRSAISIAAPQLINDFGMTRTDIGFLGTVFSWTYAFASCLPAGSWTNSVPAGCTSLLSPPGASLPR